MSFIQISNLCRSLYTQKYILACILGRPNRIISMSLTLNHTVLSRALDSDISDCRLALSRRVYSPSRSNAKFLNINNYEINVIYILHIIVSHIYIYICNLCFGFQSLINCILIRIFSLTSAINVNFDSIRLPRKVR